MQAHPPIHLDPAAPGTTFDAFADDAVAETRGDRSRVRTRRGGGRAPYPLLPVIGICAGIGLAYVSQTAHLTQTQYQATSAQAEQARLQREANSLQDELNRLTDPSRIDAAAQRLGLHPPSAWTYVVAVPPPIAVPAPTGASTGAGPTRAPATHVVEAMVGSLGDGPGTLAGRSSQAPVARTP